MARPPRLSPPQADDGGQAALFVVETCSRTARTLRYFSFSRLALEQDLNVFKPVLPDLNMVKFQLLI
jgi:hypothetical protein